MKRFNNKPRDNRPRRFNNKPRRFRDDFRPREMHKAKCSECGKDCEVPFKPSQDKPVFCKECYSKKKPRY